MVRLLSSSSKVIKMKLNDISQIFAVILFILTLIFSAMTKAMLEAEHILKKDILLLQYRWNLKLIALQKEENNTHTTKFSLTLALRKRKSPHVVSRRREVSLTCISTVIAKLRYFLLGQFKFPRKKLLTQSTINIIEKRWFSYLKKALKETKVPFSESIVNDSINLILICYAYVISLTFWYEFLTDQRVVI